MADEIVVSESLDKHYIYVDNDTHDEREITIHFIDNVTKKSKVAILREIANWLEKKPNS